MRKRKVPLRKCIVTNELKPKKQLIRIVRSPEGKVVVDVTGKKSGRGAYISPTEKCIEQLKEKNLLSRHLKTKVNARIYDELYEIIERDFS